MIKSTLLVLSLIATIGSPIYKAGISFATDIIPTTYDIASTNVIYELPLLFGDKNNDKVVSQDEYDNFNFANLLPKDGKNYNFLGIVPKDNNIYLYLYSKDVLDETNNFYFNYSDSIELDSTSPTGYKETTKNNQITLSNNYPYSNGFFYKFKLSNFSSNWNTTTDMRIYSQSIEVKTYQNVVLKTYLINDEIYFNNQIASSDTPIYTYFKDNTVQLKCEVGMLLGTLNESTHYPTDIVGVLNNMVTNGQFCFTNIETAQELSYCFVDFQNINVDELKSVTYRYNKLTYEATRFNVETVDDVSGKLYGTTNSLYDGLYKGLDVTLKNYDENDTVVLTNTVYEGYVFNETSTETYDYNYDYLETLNPNYDWNQKIIDRINSNVLTTATVEAGKDYTFTQVDTAYGWFSHVPIKRDYKLSSIINLKTMDTDFAGDEFKIMRNAFKKYSSKYRFAFLADNSTRSFQTKGTSEYIGESDNFWHYLFNAWFNNKDISHSKYYITKNTSLCHEVRDLTVLDATIRTNNQDLKIKCLNDPVSTKWIKHIGYSAPSLTDYAKNDLSHLGDFLNQNKWMWILVALGALIMLPVLWWIIYHLIIRPIAFVTGKLGGKKRKRKK